MKKIVEWRDFSVEIDDKLAMKMIECSPTSPVYEETFIEYAQVKERVLAEIAPVAIATFEKITSDEVVEGVLDEGTEVIYLITTIGSKVSDIVDGYFEKGEYLKGIMADIISDIALMSMENQLAPNIMEQCQQIKKGIRKRLEAPTDYPIEFHEKIIKKTEACERASMNLTSAYMLNPVKSMAQIFVLSNNCNECNVKHDCSSCERKCCQMKESQKIKLTVRDEDTCEEIVIDYTNGDSVLEALIKSRIFIGAPCGGDGLCGRCLIKVVEGNIYPSKSDFDKLSKKEINEGVRIACKASLYEDTTITIIIDDERVVDLAYEETVSDEEYLLDNIDVAIDIGTTTIAVALLDSVNKKVIDTHTVMNHQRVYGADVITRINSANNGKLEELCRIIKGDLQDVIRILCEKNDIKNTDINRVAIAANTTMIHMLLGLSCEGLGVYPFTAIELDWVKAEFADIFKESEFPNASVLILPGISTFVGADIVAGLTNCSIPIINKYSLFVDLGTNGEMAIFNNEKVIASSVAMGPAFEAGNISCGMPALEGAIYSADIVDEAMQYVVIGDNDPKGICGSGVLEIVSELLDSGIIDSTGLLVDKYFDEGYHVTTGKNNIPIMITQKDIREIQLAKGAIRAGIDILINRMGIEYKDIDNLYIAGGFGHNINIEKAINIGLFPKELEANIKVLGNTCLNGVIEYLKSNITDEDIDKIVSKSIEIYLSSEEDFNDRFIEFTMF